MTVIVAADFAHVNGGAGRIAIDSARGLAAAGHDVILFTAVGPIAPDLVDRPHLRVECLQQPDIWSDPDRTGAAVRGVWNRTAAARLDAVLDTVDPADTVVHLHSWTKGLSASIVRTARARGVPVVTTLHDFLIVCPTGTLFDYQRGEACPLTPMTPACVARSCDARSYAHKLWRVGRHFVQAHAGHLPGAGAHVIAISEASARRLRPLLPDDCRVHVVPNFSEVPIAPPADVAANTAVVYVGRLSAEKGPLLLAESLRRLESPGVFVGDGELADAVRAHAPGLEVTGWLPADAVRDRLRRARVLVLPSLWFETQGLVVAEAAAAGVPAVVPSTSGARDWVDDGVHGLWFTSGDAADLARQIARLRDTPAFAARLGRAAYDRFWAAPPTLASHIASLERVYDHVRASGAAA